MRIIFILFATALFAQSPVSFSYEMQYARGQERLNNQLSNYGYFQNLLDMNLGLGESVNAFAQLEYSQPPIFGESQSSLNALYLEYYGDDLLLTLGDIYFLSGYGLDVNTYVDQAIDFNNAPVGLSFEYSAFDGLTLNGLLGRGQFDYRTNPAFRLADRQLQDNIIGAGGQFTAGIFDFNFFASQIDLELGEDLVNSYYNPNDAVTLIEEDLAERFPLEIDLFRADTLHKTQGKLGLGFLLYGQDFYAEKLWSRYNKILGEEINGSMFYAAMSGEFFGFAYSYDYKDYDQAYSILVFSNPPIVVREASTTLIGRVGHSQNFVDEIGQQLELSRKFDVFGNEFDVLANVNFSRRHDGIGHQSTFEFLNDDESDNPQVNYAWQPVSDSTIIYNPPEIADYFTNDFELEDYAFYPYREAYFEFRGSHSDGHLNWMIGIDYLDEITKYHALQTNVYDESVDIPAIETGIENYWWGIWSQNYQPDWGLDSTYADDMFESTFGQTISEQISADIGEMNDTYNDRLSLSSSYEMSKSFTLPTNFSISFGSGNSVSIYSEHQWKEEIVNHDQIAADGTVDDQASHSEKYYNRYSTFSYRHAGQWTITVIQDYERNRSIFGGEPLGEVKKNNWWGYDLTMNVGHSSQLSLFYGSIKGGRICANGICAEQPAFENGFKITFRSLF